MPSEFSAALRPDWSVPGVGARMSTRADGDLRDPASRAAFEASLGAVPVWLEQVHGHRVVRVSHADVGAMAQKADASVTTEPGVACVVQVADCLPVLVAAPRARAVGAAHAGWRGLAGGVVENTVQAVCELAACRADELEVWLGPCIGPRRFEVRPDVLAAFGADPARPDDPRFVPHRPGKWMANLPMLTRERLAALGVQRIGGGRWCTVEDASRFFSYRRDGVTGRMAAAVWIDVR